MTKPPPLAVSAQEELNARLKSAVWNDDVAAITQALQQGADINAEVEVDSSAHTGTVLYLATLKGRTAAAQALLEAGADVDKEDPLFFAASGGHTAIVKALLEAGATVDLHHQNILANSSRTPLHGASNNGTLEVAKLLLAAGADPSFRGGSKNSTPAEAGRLWGYTDFTEAVQAVADDPTQRPTPESVGLDMKKRIAALEALGKPLGQFTQAEKRRIAQRETREAQRQAALRGEGI